MRKQYTAEQREKLTAAVRAGESVRTVATRMGVTPSSAYLWMKEAAAVSSAPTFARVVPARVSSLRLQLGGGVVVVEAGFDPELLRQVVAALSAT
jgi:transposase-like protein